MEPRFADEGAKPLLGQQEDQSQIPKGEVLYRLSDRLLPHKTEGLGYRSSKDLNDKVSGNIQRWNTLVKGIDDGGDWLRVGSLYLPMKLQGVHVLSTVPLGTEKEKELMLQSGEHAGKSGIRQRSEQVIATLAFILTIAFVVTAYSASEADRRSTAGIFVCLISPCFVLLALGLRLSDMNALRMDQAKLIEEKTDFLNKQGPSFRSRGGPKGMALDAVGYGYGLLDFLTKDYKGYVVHLMSEIALFRERINEFAPGARIVVTRDFFKLGPADARTHELGVEHIWQASNGDIRLFQIKLAGTLRALSFKSDGSFGVVPRFVMDHHWPKFLTLGVLGLLVGMVLIMPSLVPSHKSKFLPEDPDFHPSEALAACPCVVFFGTVTLVPMWYTFGTVFFAIAANFCFTFLLMWKRGQWTVHHTTDRAFFVGQFVRARLGRIRGMQPWRDAKVVELDEDGSVKTITFSGEDEKQECKNYDEEYKKNFCHGEDWIVVEIASFSVGEIMMMSSQVPSAIFIVPSAFAQVSSFVFLVYKSLMLVSTKGYLISFIVLYMPFVNSGVTTLVLMAMLAPTLTRVVKIDPHMPSINLMKFPGGFRTLIGIIFLVVSLPGIGLCVLGQMLFPQFSVPIECLCAMATIIIFPGSQQRLEQFLHRLCSCLSGNAKDGWRKNIADQASKVLEWLLLPLLQPINWCCKTCGILTTQTPLGSNAQVALLSCTIAVKALSWQYAFNSVVLWFWLGTNYTNAVPLSLTARHTICQECLLWDLAGQACDAAQLARLQFVNLFS